MAFPLLESIWGLISTLIHRVKIPQCFVQGPSWMRLLLNSQDTLHPGAPQFQLDQCPRDLRAHWALSHLSGLAHPTSFLSIHVSPCSAWSPSLHPPHPCKLLGRALPASPCAHTPSHSITSASFSSVHPKALCFFLGFLLSPSLHLCTSQQRFSVSKTGNCICALINI